MLLPYHKFLLLLRSSFCVRAIVIRDIWILFLFSWTCRFYLSLFQFFYLFMHFISLFWLSFDEVLCFKADCGFCLFVSFVFCSMNNLYLWFGISWQSIEQIRNRADRMMITSKELFLYSSTDIEVFLLLYLPFQWFPS